MEQLTLNKCFKAYLQGFIIFIYENFDYYYPLAQNWIFTYFNCDDVTESR